MHSHHLNCVLLDPGSGCASPLSIDGVAFGVGTWSTSRFSMVQVGQTVLDRYISLQLPRTHPVYSTSSVILSSMSMSMTTCVGCHRRFTHAGFSRHIIMTKHPVCRAVYDRRVDHHMVCNYSVASGPVGGNSGGCLCQLRSH